MIRYNNLHLWSCSRCVRQSSAATQSNTRLPHSLFTQHKTGGSMSTGASQPMSISFTRNYTHNFFSFKYHSDLSWQAFVQAPAVHEKNALTSVCLMVFSLLRHTFSIIIGMRAVFLFNITQEQLIRSMYLLETIKIYSTLNH